MLCMASHSNFQIVIMSFLYQAPTPSQKKALVCFVRARKAYQKLFKAKLKTWVATGAVQF